MKRAMRINLLMSHHPLHPPSHCACRLKFPSALELKYKGLAATCLSFWFYFVVVVLQAIQGSTGITADI
jgi:hypothetical protein